MKKIAELNEQDIQSNLWRQYLSEYPDRRNQREVFRGAVRTILALSPSPEPNNETESMLTPANSFEFEQEHRDIFFEARLSFSR